MAEGGIELNSETSPTEWTESEVFEWAMNTVGLPEAHAQKLRHHEFDGETLCDATKEDLLLCKLPMKWIMKILKALKTLLEDRKPDKVENVASSSDKNETLDDGDLEKASKCEVDVEEPDTRTEQHPQEVSPLEINPQDNKKEKQDEKISSNPPMSKSKLKYDERLKFLNDRIKGIEFEHPETNKKLDEFNLTHIFAKKGTGANSLEKNLLFLLLVERNDNLEKQDRRRRLWNEIVKHTSRWFSYLELEAQENFCMDEEENIHCLTEKALVKLRAEKTSVTFLENLDVCQYTDSTVILLMEKSLVKKNKILLGRFCLDKKSKDAVKFSFNIPNPYHGMFLSENPSNGISFENVAEIPKKNKQIAKAKVKEHAILQSNIPYKPVFDMPRQCDTDVNNKSYKEGHQLKCAETGPKDLIRPDHEFKLFEKAVEVGNDSMNKFIRETLRFACGCLNSRTNGTIHFGIADEDSEKAQRFNKYSTEIVGVPVLNKSDYIDKLKQSVAKCFVEEHSIANACIRPPEFVPVRPRWGTEQKFVIEVDIIPQISLCEGIFFKVSLPKQGERGYEGACSYQRNGASTEEMKPENLQGMLHWIPQLDKVRQEKEREHNTQISTVDVRNEELTRKLVNLMGQRRNKIDSSFKRILILSKPEDGTVATEKNLGFLKHISWELVFDFDDEGSKDSGAYSLVSSATQFDVHELQDFEKDDSLLEGILDKPMWIFANGWREIGQKPYDAKEFNKSDRKRGLTKLLQFVSEAYVKSRTIVIFLLLSPASQSMTVAYGVFANYFSENQMAYICDGRTAFESWEEHLTSWYTSIEKVRERGVIGIEWPHVCQAVLQLTEGFACDKIYIPATPGNLIEYQNNKHNKNIMTVLNTKECDDMQSLEHSDFKIYSLGEEEKFYEGNSLTWKNLWFTDKGERHVLQRDCYKELKDKVCDTLKLDGRYNRVGKVTLYHQRGTGATTVLTQVLWHYSRETPYHCRCCIVKMVTDETVDELMKFRNAGISDSHSRTLPVLALVDDIEESLFQELYARAGEAAADIYDSDYPIIVFLRGHRSVCPKVLKHEDEYYSSVLEYGLTDEEFHDFRRKYEEIRERHNLNSNEFEEYADKSLLSFRILMCKDNKARKDYVENIVKKAFKDFDEREYTLIKYLALLNLYDPYPVFISCFDRLMVTQALLKKHYATNWFDEINGGAGQLLKIHDVSEHYGTGTAVSMKHPLIAECALEYIASSRNKSISNIALEFLNSGIFNTMSCYPKTIEHLREATNTILKLRVKRKQGDRPELNTLFSPLIEKILRPIGTERKALKENVLKAVGVLEAGLKIFDDPMLGQHIARVFYVNAKSWSGKDEVEEWFQEAVRFVDEGIRKKPNSPAMHDTMGRIYREKMEVLFKKVRMNNLVLHKEDAETALSLAFTSIKWFKKSQEVSAHFNIGNKADYLGELSVMFLLLDLLHCVEVFRGREGKKTLFKYLIHEDFIPEEIDGIWKDYHDRMKHLRAQYQKSAGQIEEELSVFKQYAREDIDYVLGERLTKFKLKFFYYFFEEGESEKMRISVDLPFEERWKLRWLKIETYIAGDLFHSIFNIGYVTSRYKVNSPVKILKYLKEQIEENLRDKEYVFHYRDAFGLITISMALHSPFKETDSSNPNEEYHRIYSLVEKFYESEEKRHSKYLYAYLFRMMFLWPHDTKGLLPHNYQPNKFKEALIKLQERVDQKDTGREDEAKHGLHTKMTFRERQSRKALTTIFYLGKGPGLNVFVHINELPIKRYSNRRAILWKSREVKQRLKRCHGMRVSKDRIEMNNLYDKDQSIIVKIDVREKTFSKGKATFFMGFSWRGPIAFDVQSEEGDSPHSGVRSFPGMCPQDEQKDLESSYDYNQYCLQLGKLTQKLDEIQILKEKKKSGQRLEENQLQKIQEEEDVKERRSRLREKYDDDDGDLDYF